MIREARFLISRKPFAIDLSTVTAEQVKHGDSDPYYNLSGQADALWIRRQKGVDRACIGTLSLFRHYLSEPVNLDDPHAILTADLDGRYGGECHGRWDGSRYWGAQEPALMEQHLAVLRPMLENHQNPPSGYDGWWTFQGRAN
ncbi:hypothetical protein OG883_44290 [Streptomyces sp. NBC_01142]|uniref:hypothetical protein n=1 Tax=Streptomyces sp. NBC_01142 TaxID=2975865 RepID=UPI002250FC58|nr:hypothetical protein [Streptomyces sp. NBC_01142]MCX4826664.1 hypothetical protein [Streptomyces sp. NBC_01142]